MLDFLTRVYERIKIFIHKYLNITLYKNDIKLYGIPKLKYRKNIKLADGVRINEKVFLHGFGGIEIKKNVTLSYGAVILTTGYDTELLIKGGVREHKKECVTIGENVWIGANSVILPGVTIANNCIIAAGSIVSKSLMETDALYAGVPAKKIKSYKN